MRFALPLTFALLLPAIARADAVDDKVSDFMRLTLTQGAEIAVLRDGQVVRAEGYGLADVEHNVKVKKDTVFKIGSVSKQFISTAIMLLQQDGKLKVDDKLSSYLPDIPDAWKRITLRHLLTHTSGLVRESPGFRWYEDRPLADVIRDAYSTPLQSAPGDKYEYSNLGYFILAEVVSRVSGQPWDKFLDQRVFRPLGMTSTRTTSASSLIPDRALGYQWENGRLTNSPQYVAVRPSGAFLSTVLDLAKWEVALEGSQILTAESQKQMWTPSVLNDGKPSTYGFGWSIVHAKGHLAIFHDGSLPGFRAQFSRFPDDKLAVIVLLNENSANAQILADEIAATYIPDFAPAPFKPAASFDEAGKGTVEALLRGLESGSAVTDLITPELAKAMDVATEQVRFKGFGSLLSLTPLDSTGLRVTRYLAQFQNIRIVVSTGMASGKVSGLRLSLE